MIAGSNKSEKPNNTRGIDKVHLKADCVQGRIVNGTRESILYIFALSSPPVEKTYKEPKAIFLKEQTILFCLVLRFI